MKGDEVRAHALAAFLEGGYLDAEIEPLESAVRALQELVASLAPDEDRVRFLAESWDPPPSAAPAPAMAALALGVADLAVSLVFYRDGLGLRERRVGRGDAELDAGGIALRLESRRGERGPEGGTEIEFHTPRLDEVIQTLRDQGHAVHVHGSDPRRRTAEVRDPDGRRLVLRVDDRAERGRLA